MIPVFKRKLRNKPRISYCEAPDLNLDDYVYCTACKDYVYEYCAIHGALLIVPDDQVPKVPSASPTGRAALTIPSVFLYLAPSTIPNAGVGVFASRTLPAGVRFGPYRGVRSDTLRSDYCWQIHGRDRKAVSLVDGSDVSSSNWMRYVNCSRHCSEQNLAAFQYQGEIYYRTLNIIPSNMELLVFYGAQFAQKLGINIKKYNAPLDVFRKMGLPQKEPIAKTDLIVKFTPETAKKNIKEKKLAKEKAEITVNHGVEINKKLKQVSFKQDKNTTEFECDHCKQIFKSKSILINHMQSHVSVINSEVINKIDPLVYSKCLVCKKECISSDLLKMHMRFHDTLRKFQCGICLYRFRNKFTLQSHILKHRNEKLRSSTIDFGLNDVTYKCDLCCQVFNEKAKFVNHHLIHTQVKMFNCDICNKQFNQSGALKTHLRIHSGVKPYQCDVCNKRFNHTSDLKKHSRIHTGVKPYQCDVCNKQFNHSGALKIHLRIHTGVKPYQCDVCHKQFNRSGYLKIHSRIHTGVKPYQCDVCKKQFNESGTLKTHLRIHTGVKPYQCDVCNKQFKLSQHLKVHSRIHTGVKPYQCNVCNKQFNQSGALKTHLRIHTGIKPYQCDVCNKQFKKTGDLKKHSRIHTGVKPYQCNVCNKQFNQSGALKTHLRIHTGIKPYQCDVCNKQFKKTGDLKKHSRIHTGVKQYQCDVCNKQFNQSGNLKIHSRIHTGVNPLNPTSAY